MQSDYYFIEQKSKRLFIEACGAGRRTARNLVRFLESKGIPYEKITKGKYDQACILANFPSFQDRIKVGLLEQ